MTWDHNGTSEKLPYLSKDIKFNNFILKVVMLYRIILSVTLHFIIQFNMM